MDKDDEFLHIFPLRQTLEARGGLVVRHVLGLQLARISRTIIHILDGWKVEHHLRLQIKINIW